ncbi:MAG: metallophosphoesterase family protein [Candidatus Thermoplasmatota archaeon]
MRLAVMADIHSNLHALEAAAGLIRARRPDMVVCAGDVVGYGAFPDECCSIVEGMCGPCVAGNHDRAAVSGDLSGMNPFAAAAMAWTAKRLGDRSRAFLSSLEPSCRFDAGGLRASVFHGSPDDPDEYVHEDAVTAGTLLRSGGDIVVMGHTHVPYAKRLGEGLAVNPGSVGQPRDGDPRGSFAVVDTGCMECEVVRFRYPVEEAADAIVSAGLPRVLADRLAVGR